MKTLGKNTLTWALGLVLSLAAMTMTTGCKDDNATDGAPNLTVTPTTVPVPLEGSTTLTIDIKSNRSWTINIPADVTWLMADKLSGKGNATVTFSAGAYSGSSTRTAVVSVKSSDFNKTVPVTFSQSAMPVDGYASFYETWNDAENNGTAAVNGWSVVHLQGDRDWGGKIFNENRYVQATGHSTTAPEGPMEAWLISPALDIDAASPKTMSFSTAAGYFNDDTKLEVYVMNSANPSTATKTKLEGVRIVAKTDPLSGSYTSWIPSGDVSLSSYTGTIYIGFRYTGTIGNSKSTTYQFDNFRFGNAEAPSLPTVTTSLPGDISGTTAVLGGSYIQGSGAVTEVGVEYKLSSAGTYTVQAAAAVANPFSVTVTVADGSAYTYRAYAKAGGQTAYGEEKTFTAGTQALGTRSNPYSVAQAITAQGESGKYVRGYIVGIVNNGVTSYTGVSDANFTAPFNSSTNVFIADNAAETDPAKCVNVKLNDNPSSVPSMRGEVNLLDHADNKGKLLLVGGNLKQAFSALSGIREITDYQMTGSGAASLSVTPPSMTIAAEGTAQTANVTATAGLAWSVSTNQTWCKVNNGATANGTGTGTFTVSCDVNAGSLRSATVTITAAGVANQTIAVSQSAAGSVSLSVTPPSMTIAAEGTAQTANVTATAGLAWSVSTNQTWCKVNNGATANGTGTGTFTVSCDANTGSLRNAIVTITAPGVANQTIAISQSAPGAAGNLVVNGTFASWTGTTPDSWTIDANANWSQNPGGGIKVQGKGASGSTAKVYQNVPVTVGRTYTLTFKYTADAEQLRIWSGFAATAAATGSTTWTATPEANDVFRTNNGYFPVAATLTSWSQDFTATDAYFHLELRAYKNLGTGVITDVSIVEKN